MSQNPYQTSNVNYGPMVQNAEASVRSSFIRSTYLHLFGAVLLCVLIDTAIFSLFFDQLEPLVRKLSQGWNMILFFVGFMAVSGLADSWARNGTSKAMQYAGLVLCVFAYAVFFVPILLIAEMTSPGAIESAGVVTAVVFGGLTVTVFITKADFSFLRMFLVVLSCCAFGLILVSLIFGYALGNWFIDRRLFGTYLHLFGAVLLCVLIMIRPPIFSLFFDQLEPLVPKIEPGLEHDPVFCWFHGR